MRLAVAWDVGDGGWDLGPAGPTPISPSDADTVAVGAPSGQVPSGHECGDAAGQTG